MIILSKPLPLFSIDTQSNFILNLETVKTLNQFCIDLSSKLEPKLKVISIAGDYQTGKSTLMNNLLMTHDGFKTKNSVSALSTSEIQVVPVYNQQSNQYLLFIDTEGLNNPQQINPLQNSTSLLYLLALISDTVIFNTRGAIDESQMDTVALVSSQLRQLILGSNSIDSQINISNFIWVLRDWGLSWESELVNSQEPSYEYFENLLSTSKYQIIKQIFSKKRGCITMVQPCNREDQLKQLGRFNGYKPQLLRKQFIEGLQQVQKFMDETQSWRTFQSFLRDSQRYLSHLNKQAHKQLAIPWKIAEPQQQDQIRKLSASLKQAIEQKFATINQQNEILTHVQLTKIDGYVGSLMHRFKPFPKRAFKEKYKTLLNFYKNLKEILVEANKKRISESLKLMLDQSYSRLHESFQLMRSTAEQMCQQIEQWVIDISKIYYNQIHKYYGTRRPQSIHELHKLVLDKLLHQAFPFLIKHTQNQWLSYYEQKMQIFESDLIASTKQKMREEVFTIQSQQQAELQKQKQHEKIIDRMQQLYSKLKTQYELKVNELSAFQQINNNLKQELIKQMQESKQSMKMMKEQLQEAHICLSDEKKQKERYINELLAIKQQFSNQNIEDIDKYAKEKQEILEMMAQESHKREKLTVEKIRLEGQLTEKEQQIAIKQNTIKQLEQSTKVQFLRMMADKEQIFTKEKERMEQQFLVLKEKYQSNVAQLKQLQKNMGNKQQQMSAIFDKFQSLNEQCEKLENKSATAMEICIKQGQAYQKHIQQLSVQLQQNINQKELLKQENTTNKQRFDRQLTLYTNKLKQNRQQIQEVAKRKYEMIIKDLNIELSQLKQERRRKPNLSINIDRQLLLINPVSTYRQTDCQACAQLQKHLILKNQESSKFFKENEELRKFIEAKHLQNEIQIRNRVCQIESMYEGRITDIRQAGSKADDTIKMQRELIKKYEERIVQLEFKISQPKAVTQLNHQNEQLRKYQDKIKQKQQRIKILEQQNAYLLQENGKQHKGKQKYQQQQAKLEENSSLLQKQPEDAFSKENRHEKNLHKIIKKLKKQYSQSDTAQSKHSNISEKRLHQKNQQIEILKTRLEQVTEESLMNRAKYEQLSKEFQQQLGNIVTEFQVRFSEQHRRNQYLQQAYKHQKQNANRMIEQSEQLKQMISELKSLLIQEKASKDKMIQQLQQIRSKSWKNSNEEQIHSKILSYHNKNLKTPGSKYQSIYDQIFQ